MCYAARQAATSAWGARFRPGPESSGTVPFHGILLITGPTGGGKSHVAAPSGANKGAQHPDGEDPVEYQLPGIGQMQVRPKINLTFANCLRHILRQDPDIIMIGEIRDRETAEIAIQASLTGHLVLSTLHTNDSASAVTRLIDMGIEPYLISSTVAGVMAQRLLRVICPECKEAHRPQEAAALAQEFRRIGAENPQLYKGRGCEKCIQTGYLGRTGIFEIMRLDDSMKELIAQHRGSHILKQAAIENGMTTLREDGLRKALAGITTLEEVFRVTQDSAHAGTGETADARHWSEIVIDPDIVGTAAPMSSPAGHRGPSEGRPKSLPLHPAASTLLHAGMPCSALFAFVEQLQFPTVTVLALRAGDPRRRTSGSATTVNDRTTEALGDTQLFSPRRQQWR
jgi:hypothetical protein